MTSYNTTLPHGDSADLWIEGFESWFLIFYLAALYWFSHCPTGLFILSNSVFDYVVPQIYPAVVEDHPPVSADHHPPCSGGDVHHDVHPRETSAHNEDSQWKPPKLQSKFRAMFPAGTTDCDPRSGTRGWDSLTPVMITRSATVSLLVPDFLHSRVTSHRVFLSPTLTGLTDTTSLSNWMC